MWNDPIVAEVRAVRERLAAQFGFDVHSIFKDLRNRQTKLGDRVVHEIRKPKTEPVASPDCHSAALHGGR
jgi:hypothetical protein